MSVLMTDHIQEALNRIDDWDLSDIDLSHALEATAIALAGRWLDDDDPSASIHTALHG